MEAQMEANIDFFLSDKISFLFSKKAHNITQKAVFN